MSKKYYYLIWLIIVGLLHKAAFAESAPESSGNQIRKVTGTVVGSDEGPLPGASVVVKGTSNGVVTDLSGNYSLSVPEEGAVLVFSFVGYETQEVILGDQSIVNVTLEVSVESLSEVVVIGYGQVKKSDVTGSISSVKSDELKAVPVTSFEQALQGRAAGVVVNQSSGAPGSSASIRIRGVSSITASNEPLYVVDGMLINSSDATTGSVSPLSSINPNDIESIEILKDASATAIYGSRGASGVILITTKSGRSGVSTIDFESYYGVQQVSNKMDLLNASQFGEFYNEAKINAGQQPGYVNPSNLGKGTDWQEEVFHDAPIQNYQISFTGGSEKVRYAVSGGIFDQDGIVINTDFRRYSARTKIDADVKDWLNLTGNVAYSSATGNSANTGLTLIVPGVVLGALGMNPILPVHDPSREGGYTFQNTVGGGSPVIGTVLGNPVAELKDIQNLSTTSRIIGNVGANIKFTEGLVFKSTLGIDGSNSKYSHFVPSWVREGYSVDGIAEIYTFQAFTWLNENTITYDKRMGDHYLNVVLGFTTQEFKNEYVNNSAFGISDNLGYHNLALAEDPQAPVNGESKWSMISYLGRAQYSIMDRYLFTLTGRLDGSSKFAEGNQYSFFPSGAVAWRISEEPFMPSSDVLSDLKLKASIGIIGNQAIGPYASLPLVASYGQGVYNDGLTVNSYTSSQIQSYNNPDLKWETTRTINAGADVGLFDGRIFITAEYYQKYTYDLLLTTPISSTTGFESSLLNVGNIKNNGFDLEISTVNFNEENEFQWNTAVNFSIVRNEITKLATDEDVILGNGLILREGESIGTFYGYQFDGIFQTDDEASSSPVFSNQTSGAGQAKAGDRKYRNVNDEDNVIDSDDRTIIGNALPDFTAGINNNLSFKNITLSFFIQGSYGNEMINLNRLFLEDMTATHNVSADAWEKRWTPENPGNKYPRVLANRTTDVGTISSKFVEDASYIRLRNITLGYNIPVNLLQSLGLRSLRVYASASNILTITNYSGFDPEGSSYGSQTAYPGIDQGRYPLTKTYLFGLNIGL